MNYCILAVSTCDCFLTVEPACSCVLQHLTIGKLLRPNGKLMFSVKASVINSFVIKNFWNASGWSPDSMMIHHQRWDARQMNNGQTVTSQVDVQNRQRHLCKWNHKDISHLDNKHHVTACMMPLGETITSQKPDWFSHKQVHSVGRAYI